MDMWAVHVEVRLRRQLAPEAVDRLMDALGPFHGALGTSPRGWVSAQLTVPAQGLVQAFLTAHSLAATHLGDPVSLEVMPEDEWDARQVFVPMPELVGATEAAAMIGVSRQRVIQMVEEGKLPGRVVGRSTVIPRQSVEEWLDQREMDGR